MPLYRRECRVLRPRMMALGLIPLAVCGLCTLEQAFLNHGLPGHRHARFGNTKGHSEVRVRLALQQARDERGDGSGHDFALYSGEHGWGRANSDGNPVSWLSSEGCGGHEGGSRVSR